MGNCQTAEEAAAVVVQHPGGRVERLYWATSAAEVMRANPGHYVAALVTIRVAEEKHAHARPQGRGAGGAVRLTRVRLLKPRDTLQLGHAYRLVAVDEVSKAVQARKEEKSRRAAQQRRQRQLESKLATGGPATGGDDQPQLDEGIDQDQLEHQDRDSHRSNSATHSRHRQWRPSLQSIAEVSS